MPTRLSDHDIDAFWLWIVSQWPALEALGNADEPFWDVVLGRLKELDPGLCFELSSPPPPRELIVTAQGDANLFEAVERIVSRAPHKDGWQFIALKPPLGFSFATTYEGRPFDGRDMWFLPLTSKTRPDDLGLRVGIPDLNQEDFPTARNAVLVIMETALGERAAREVVLVEVVALPKDPEQLGYIELPELPTYLKWRKGRSVS